MSARFLAALLSAGMLSPTAARGVERRDPRVEAALARIEPTRLHDTVAKLVSFGTRHTLSETASDARGIGAARRWLQAQFKERLQLQGSRLTAFEDRFTAEPGPRIKAPVELLNVGAVLPGNDSGRSKQAVVVTGHYDSRASDPLDATSDAPGANDDGSGTAMLLELARVFAAEQPSISIYFVAVAGEEQGLVGSRHLAEKLKAQGLDVLAMVSVDIAGNGEGQDGLRDTATARLFAEGVSGVETSEGKKLREALGADNDGSARELARYLSRTASRYVDDLRLRVLLRRDRIARGSDHFSFSAQGFPAVRLSEAREHYRRQHQDVRVEGGVAYGDDLAHFDAAYAARICRALGAGLLALGFAPAAPQKVTLGGAVSPDTNLSWTLPDRKAADIVLYRRPAEAVGWESARSLGRTLSVTLPSTVPDDFFFAVATVDAAGNESLPQPPTLLGK